MFGLGTLARVARELRQDLTAAQERDPAARGLGRAEILLTYGGVQALLVHRIAHAAEEAGLPIVPHALAYMGRMTTGVEIHPRAQIGEALFIDHGAGVVIGETAEIGDDSTLYHGVTLGGTSWNKGKRHPTLGRSVVIGAGAKILGPVLVGDGAKIGSNAVVVRDVPPGATAVGIPARIATVEDQARREEKASQIGFSAYAISADMNDPVVQAIHKLLDHAAVTEDRFNRLVAQLQRGGLDCGDAKAVADAFDPRQINKMLE
jgi:serine O-acetyltransferase